jgi:leucyl aminopeptidase
MHFSTSLTAIAASAQLVIASPVQSGEPPQPDMRLIKISEDEPAFWISKQDRFEQYTAKNIGFFDVTNVKVSAWPLLRQSSSAHSLLRMSRYSRLWN